MTDRLLHLSDNSFLHNRHFVVDFSQALGYILI